MFNLFRLCHTASGTLVPQEGLTSYSKQWKHGILTTEPPRTSPHLKIHQYKSQMGPQVYLVIIVTSLKSFCVGVLTLKWLSLFTSLFSKSQHTHQPLAFHTLLWADDLTVRLTVLSPLSDDITLTEQKQPHTKSSLPGQHSRANIFPWARPPFFPLYHWDEGLLLLKWQSPNAVFITALSLLQFRLRVSCIPSFSLCWIIPSTARAALGTFHFTKNSP